MSFIKRLKIITWKQIKLKKYKYNYIILEFLIIISVFYIFQLISKNFMTKYNEDKELNSAVIYPKIEGNKFIEYAKTFQKIYYVPNSSKVHELMNNVFKLISGPISYKGFPNIQKLLEKINVTNSIGIIFDIPEEYETRNNITYTFVSINNNIETDSLMYIKNNEGIYDPNVRNFYNEYAGLQVAINKILIEKYYCILSNNTYDKMSVQSFPYPKYKKKEPKLHVKFISPILCMVVFVLTTTLISIIIEEKQNGIKELMKIMGLQDQFIWIGWFIYTFTSGFFTISIITIMLKYNYLGPEFTLLKNINPIILWCLILLFYIANVAYCFTFTALLHNSTIALTLFIFIPLLIKYFMSYIDNVFKSKILHSIFLLIPMIAFDEGFHQIEYTEYHDIYIGWRNINFYSASNNNNISILYIFDILMFDAILYFLLAYYISKINPGKYGIPQSPFIIFQQSKKKSENNFVLQNTITTHGNNTSNKNINFNEEVCIEINNLYKQFNNKVYLNGLSLKIYKGKILALLGHNGAGKTTLLNILTGYIKSTSGHIKYKDIDVLTEMTEFRKDLGVCPQEDKLLPYLSLEEHLYFFGMLKGMVIEDVKIEAHQYMEKMDMLYHCKSNISTLSGGMKRKLCLAISLMGKAKVIILDEPTSGLDIQSRRLMWDILKDLTNGRTILISTHHIEEADYLSDYIAILRHGTLQCWGETESLKQKYDVGYELTVRRELDISFIDIDNLFIKFYDNVKMESISADMMEKKYIIPLYKTNLLEALFRYIEENNVGITNINLTCTTLEEIMLKDGVFSTDNSDQCDESNDVSFAKLILDLQTYEIFQTGKSLYFQQLIALFYKKWLFFSRNYTLFLLKIVLTTLVVWFIMGTNDKSETHTQKAISLKIQLYNNTKIMRYESSSKNTSSDNFLYKYLYKYVDKSDIICNEQDILDSLLDIGQYDLMQYMNIMFATNFNETEHTLMYNPNGIYSLPVAIDIYTNALLLENNINAEITTINSIISLDLDIMDSLVNEKFPWIIVLIFFSIELTSFFVMELNIERYNHFKQIQFMSNLSPTLYWISNILFDSILFIIIILIRIIGIKLLSYDCHLLTLDKPLGIFMLVFTIYIIAVLLFSYVLAHLSNSEDESYLIITLINSLGCIATTIYYYLKQVTIDPIKYANSMWILVPEFIIHLVPSLNFTFICNKIFNIYFSNLNKKNTLSNMEYENPYLVYKSTQNPDGLINDVLFMLVDILLYAIILACIEIGYFEMLSNWFGLCLYNILSKSKKNIECGDDDVINEGQLIDHILLTDSNVLKKEILLNYHLKKIYYKRFKPFLSINDISFKVQKGEIFGLLGKNSSGKSTLFKMMVGEISPSRGDSLISGYWMSKNKKICWQKIGYCSQNNYLLPELSARELLTSIIRLRGVCPRNIPVTVDTWLLIFGLKEFENFPSGTYSGGTQRKLCTAISLIGNPSVVFLDEPTTGVDIQGRKKFFEIIKHGKQNDQTVILSSHNINECENLCDKLTVIFKGNLKYIGTVEHLKNLYIKGFSVIIKLFDTTNETKLCTIKKDMEKYFQCILVTELKTQLHYKIVWTMTTIKWTKIFSQMEYMKNCHKNAIKYYSITPLSLEDTLINFPMVANL